MNTEVHPSQFPRIIWFLSSHAIELTGKINEVQPYLIPPFYACRATYVTRTLLMRSSLNRPHKSGVKAGNEASKGELENDEIIWFTCVKQQRERVVPTTNHLTPSLAASHVQ